MSLTHGDQRGQVADDVKQLSARVHSTNRDLALLAPTAGWRHALRMAGPGPVAQVECLLGPTRPRPSLCNELGERAWKLINHLSPNHLTFGCGTDANDTGKVGAAMLRETLSLYCQPDQPAHARHVDGILSVRQQAVTRQLPFSGPIVHGRGVEIQLLLDEAGYEGSSPFLLASILERFFARFAGFNSFTQVELVCPTRGPLHRWPVRLGDTAPL